MEFYAFFDSPDLYKHQNKFYEDGGSPKLLATLKEFITLRKGEIKAIRAAVYLFNNSSLHTFFNSLAQVGIQVELITIPLDGYDNKNPKQLCDLEGKVKCYKKQTKYSLAEMLLKAFKAGESNPNYKLFFAPHLYVRSPFLKPFSRGEAPYSLHIKCFYIEYQQENKGAIILTSSNLAVRDLVKEENLLIIENDLDSNKAYLDFFNKLKVNSVKLPEEEGVADSYFDKPVVSEICRSGNIGFLAPFYKRSPEFAESLLIDLIRNAKKRVYIAAQHLAAINYSVPAKYSSYNQLVTRKGLLYEVVEKARKGLDIKCLSQTFYAREWKGNKFRTPANKAQFQEFFEVVSKGVNTSFYINENLHSKYIIVDDKLIVTSFNYTPTQFIYLDKVVINRFSYIPGFRYNGIFSEVGAYYVCENIAVVNAYLRNFNKILRKEATVKVA